MTTDELFSYFRNLKIKLWIDGNQLRYSAPKGALTPVLRKEIAEHKSEIITFLCKARHISQSSSPPILPISRDRELPLSYAQERLWFLDQFEPDSSFYNVPYPIPWPGPINVTALKKSFNEIVRRHEILRTTFAVVDGKAVQVISNSLTVDLPVIDIRHMPEAERETESQRLTTEESQRPFDLSRGPLLRTTLLQLENEAYVLLLTMHHIVSDGWSMGIFFQELTVLYEAYCNWKPSPLPELPIQYADFAYWQHQWLKGEVLEYHLAYWKKQLENAPVLLELPTDRPRPAVQTFRGAVQSFVLYPSLTKALNVLSQKEEVTLFMTLLAAFITLIYRYTGYKDIVIGSPIANRNKEEIEGLIGFFVNTLVLRTKVVGDLSFLELLKQVREVTLEAYSHQDLPFEKLVAELQPERNLTYNPLFQVMFSLQNTQTLPRTSSESTQSHSEPTRGFPQLVLSTAKFDLTLFVAETGKGLMGSFEYNSDLFNASTITRMEGHFQTILEGITKDPEQRLAALPLLTRAERKQLLVEWNDTKADYPRDKCIHQLFEDRVDRSPDSIAVVFMDEQLTYRELNRRANQVAHYLLKLGVGPEICVGICMERSLNLVIGLLGILKAGGVYVPLDPEYPEERLSFMLNDARVPVLLTQERLAGGIPSHDAHVVCLDSKREILAAESDENPHSDVTPENLVYVIYSSGSTGKLKGVMAEHRGLCNVAESQIQILNVCQESRVLHLASLGFDASLFEIVMALHVGSTLCLGTKESLIPGQALMKMLRRQSITHVTLTPALLTALTHNELPDLRTIIIRGGTCSAKLVELWTKGRQLLSTYGPIEAADYSTVLKCTDKNQKPTIGRPIANTQVYILDRYCWPVPVGVLGEIYIGGVGLARGYFNRPDLTAEKFIPNPFSEEPGGRLYKTGDLSRYLPDGTIEFLGRINEQVKVDGFRIDLEEIESVLGKHPEVQYAVVVVREDIPDEKRLVAYIVPEQDVTCMNSELEKLLRENLPEYMVPSAFVIIKDFPLTHNGKIDLERLPVPEMVRPESDDTFLAPRNNTEETLVDIWKDVLGIERIGVHDNFFELGGHSLMATLIISRIREKLQVELPLHKMFADPTVAGMAENVEIIQWATQEMSDFSSATVNDQEKEGEL